MTKEEILAMEVGEELDKLVAEARGEPMPEFIPENALDLQLAGSPIKSPKGNWLCLCNYDEGDIPTWRPLPYSADISAAWQVAVEMLSLGFCLELYAPKPLAIKWSALFVANVSGRRFKKVYTEFAPEAICKAALLARLDEIKRFEEGEC